MRVRESKELAAWAEEGVEEGESRGTARRHSKGCRGRGTGGGEEERAQSTLDCRARLMRRQAAEQTRSRASRERNSTQQVAHMLAAGRRRSATWTAHGPVPPMHKSWVDR